MKRRQFIQYGLWGGAMSLVSGALGSERSLARSAQQQSQRQAYDWVILYWMPYDNDLSRFGAPILEMLKRGVRSKNLLVAVEADFADAESMSRTVITQGKVRHQILDTADSASERNFAEYLNWAQANFSASKWAVIFLGHGGRLDEISPDYETLLGDEARHRWMNIETLSEILTEFNQKIGDRLELVFFQNCNKGTIEAHYTFRETAKYTLSSQLLLGAPNYYYESLLQFVGQNPEIDGGQFAAKIMEFEGSDMYHSYTATDNKTIQALPTKLNPLIDAILSSQISNFSIDSLKTYRYMGDRFADSLEFFGALVQQANAGSLELEQFSQFLKDSMIYKVQAGGELLAPKLRKTYENLSGLGLLLPEDQAKLDQYRYLKVFSDLKLTELFDRVLFA